MKICRITVSVYFAVMVACILVMDTTGLALLALLCAALHEAGHFFAMWLVKAPVEEITFRAFGLDIRLSGSTRLSYGQETAVALAGCASNLLFGLAAFISYRAGFCMGQMQAFCFMNLCLCAFNLLPVGPLDGGRALEAALLRHMQPEKAHGLVSLTSAVFIVPLVFLGVYLLRATGCNFSLLLAAVYLAACLVTRSGMLEFAK